MQVERLDPSAAHKASAQADAPELEALLESLHTSLGEVRTRIGPLVNEVSNSHHLRIFLASRRDVFMLSKGNTAAAAC